MAIEIQCILPYVTLHKTMKQRSIIARFIDIIYQKNITQTSIQRDGILLGENES